MFLSAAVTLISVVLKYLTSLSIHFPNHSAVLKTNSYEAVISGLQTYIVHIQNCILVPCVTNNFAFCFYNVHLSPRSEETNDAPIMSTTSSTYIYHQE